MQVLLLRPCIRFASPSCYMLHSPPRLDHPDLEFLWAVRIIILLITQFSAVSCYLYSPPSTIYPLPSTLYHLPSTIYHPPSTLYHLPSTLYSIPSTIYPLPSTIYPLPCTLYHLPFTIYHLPSTIYPLPSILYLLPSTLYPLPSTLYPYAHRSSPHTPRPSPAPPSVNNMQSAPIRPPTQRNVRTPYKLSNPTLSDVSTHKAFWTFRSSLPPPSPQSVLFRYVCLYLTTDLVRSSSVSSFGSCVQFIIILFFRPSVRGLHVPCALCC